MTGDGGRGSIVLTGKSQCACCICYFAKSEQTHNVAVNILLDRLYITFIESCFIVDLLVYIQ